MIVQCPNCCHSVVVNGLGRKRLNIPLRNVLEALQAPRFYRGSIKAAAQELACSEAYIFGVLKANGLRLRDVVTFLPVRGTQTGRQVETEGVIK